MARSRRHELATKPVNSLRSFLRVDKLEDRVTPDNGLWAAVFRGDYGYGEQQDINRLLDLFTANGTTNDEVAVVQTLDNFGAFALQTPLSTTEAALYTEISTVPGFVFLQPVNEDKNLFLNGRNRDSFRGPSDIPAFIKREQQGLVPPQGGPVDPGEPNDVLTNNNTGSTGTANFTQSETTVIAFGNTVLIGYNDSGSFTGGANKFTGFARSTDGGNTFTDGGTLPTSAIGDAGDPVLARNNTTGRIYFSTLGFSGGSTIQMFRSDDGGATWLPPVNATPGGGSEDKQWHTVDNFPGAGNGNVYLLTRNFGSGGGIFFYRSLDNGNTFGPTGGTLITAGNQGAFITVAPDHSIQAYWYAGTTIQMRRSTDFGATFGAPITVASGLVGGTNGDLGLTGRRQGTTTFSGFRSNEFPHAVVNPVNGHMYVTFANNPPGTDKADVFVVVSTNGGLTWSAPQRVNDDATTTDQWQPTLAVTPDGSRLGIFYYSRQEDPLENNLFKYWGRIANISGSTLNFDPSFAVSDTASLPEFGRDSVVNSVYMGDYDTAYATNDAFHTVWADNRSDLPGGAGRKDPNVYYRKIELGFAVTTTTPGVGSTVSVAPTSFTVNFSDPYDAGSVAAGDFTVNGIPATGFTPVDADTITFTYGASPVTVQGLQTMAVAAGAITTGGGTEPILAFSGQFRYDVLTLAVVSTTPPFPNGVFTLPGPFTYDVTFNEPVDPASVQAADLQLSGIAGATVTGVTVLPGNTTARFTIAMPNTEGSLTASIPAGLVTDAFGNAGSAFSAVYQVDIGTVPYPVPLTAKNPLGSRVYDPLATGIVNFAGDTDSFTINLDANQKLSILVRPTSPTLQPRVELFNAANVSLGFASAGAAGQVTGFQTFNVSAAGVYRIAVSGVGSTTGGYTVQVILNAAFETEGVVSGSTNNTLGTAQNIDGSFRTETTAFNNGSIGNVLGLTDTAAGYAATAVPFAFTNIATTGTPLVLSGDDSATTTTIPFTFNYYGNNVTSVGVSTNGLLTFGGTSTLFTNTSLASNPTLATIAVFWDDLFVNGTTGRVLTQTIGAVGSRQFIVQWNQVHFLSDTAGDPLTFQAILSEGSNTIRFNYLDLETAGNGQNNGASATVGVKAANPTNGQFLDLAVNNGPNTFVGTGQSTLITPALATPDLYSMTLTAGQKVTVGIAATTAVSGTLNVELLNAGGTVIATGVAGSTNLGSVISNFTAPAGGTYYVRVTGAGNVPYDVVVTKDAGFDTEANNSAATAQNLTGTTGAFGAIAPSGQYLGSVLSPTFEDISTTGTVISALTGADDTATTITPGFSFTLYGVTHTTFGVSSNGLITFGGSDASLTNSDLTTTPTLPAVAVFWDDLFITNSAGNARVYSQVLGTGSNQRLVIQWDKITFFSGGTGADTLTFQAQLFADGRIQLNYLDLVSGSAAGNNGGSATVGVKAAGTQGPNRLLLAQNVVGGNTFVGTNKSTLISQPPGDDWYSVTLAADQTVLQVETSTPGDGPGEFVNVLNPKIDVYDATGTTLIASGVVLGDGRNESAFITGLTPGASYRIKVSPQGSTVGEYFLTATAIRTPTITTKVDDGLPNTWGPDGSFTVPNPAANGWTNVTGAGYLNDYTVHADNVNEAANNFAVWNIRITSTTPELFASWVARPQNATNATYQVYRGTTLLSTVVVNQRFTPNDALFGTTLLESLGTYSVPAGTTMLTVRLLTLGANGDVVADGVFDPPAGQVIRLAPPFDVVNTGSPVFLGDSMAKALPPIPTTTTPSPVTVSAGVRQSIAVDGFGTRAGTVGSPEAPKPITAVRAIVTQSEPVGVSVGSAAKPTAASAPTIAPPVDGWYGERIWIDSDATDEIIDLH